MNESFCAGGSRGKHKINRNELEKIRQKLLKIKTSTILSRRTAASWQLTLPLPRLPQSPLPLPLQPPSPEPPRMCYHRYYHHDLHRYRCSYSYRRRSAATTATGTVTGTVPPASTATDATTVSSPFNNTSVVPDALQVVTFVSTVTVRLPPPLTVAALLAVASLAEAALADAPLPSPLPFPLQLPLLLSLTPPLPPPVRTP